MFTQECIPVERNFIGLFHFTQTARNEYYLSIIERKSDPLKTFYYTIFSKKDIKERSWNRIKRININKELKCAIEEILGFSQILDNKGELLIFLSIQAKEGEIHLFLVNSHDYGKSWDRVRKISDENSAWNITHSPIIMEKTFRFGTIFVPIEDKFTGTAFLLISEDNGEHWHSSLNIDPEALSEMLENDQQQPKDQNINDGYIYTLHSAAIVERTDEKLMMIFRSKGTSHFLAAISSDYGNTWDQYKILSGLEALHGPYYDIQHIKDTEQNLSGSVLIAGQTIPPSKTLPYTSLWFSSNNGESYYLLWVSESPLNHMEHRKFVLYEDFNEIFHILTLKDNTVIEHQWGVLDV